MSDLDEVKLTLENDVKFYHAYLAASGDEKYPIIRRFTLLLCRNRYLLNRECGELKQYFNDRYVGDPAMNMRVSKPRFSPELNAYIPPTDQFVDQFKEPESTMPASFFIEKKFLNGVDITTLNEDAIYTAIRSKEDEIKGLEQIQNKPKSLQKKIEDAKADIKSLVDYLDSKAA